MTRPQVGESAGRAAYLPSARLGRLQGLPDGRV